MSNSFQKLNEYSSTQDHGYDDEVEQELPDYSLQISKRIMKPIGQPNILIAPKPHHYFSSGFINCCILRDQVHSPFRVQFIYQKFGCIGEDKVVMVAIKQGGNRTSNYHIFDTGRVGGWSNNKNDQGMLGSPNHNIEEIKLDKKAGNYIGKLRKEKNDRCCYSLYDNKEEKEQIGAFTYTLPSLSKQLTEGQPPRKMQIAIPSIDKDGVMEPRASYLKNRLIDSIRKQSQTAVNLFTTKEPTYDNGTYRLNFSGRVTKASVKNMQIVDSNGEIFAQFGKVGDNRFHLDYK